MVMPTTANPSYVRVSATEHWDGVTVVPPRSGDVPAISTDDAMASCSHGSACGSVDQVPEIRLGRATTTGAGTQNADGSWRPLMDDALVFEMIWTGQQCPPVLGTGTGSASNSSPPALHTCTTVAWVDAITGDDLYGNGESSG